MQATEFDFKTFKRNDKPNSYLVCPKDYCHTRIDAVAKTYPVGIDALKQAWDKMITQQPRTKLLSETAHQRQYVQRSKVFRFPDYINVAFIPINTNQSTIAIYSHAIYGYSDFGVNKKRVQSWLTQLGSFIT